MVACAAVEKVDGACHGTRQGRDNRRVGQAAAVRGVDGPGSMHDEQNEGG